MTREFYAEYLKDSNARKRQYLIRFHEQQRGDKIIVFSDNLFALRMYAEKLRRPMIFGPTSHHERTRILYAFKHSPDVNTVLLSKVGDNSIDIPEANSCRSRRQEAQHLGRILRAKGKPQDRQAGGAEEYNAFFYSLVSTDTQEMYYSNKRQQFLIDQGYSFKVVTSLPPADEGPSLGYHHLDDQMDLLTKVLNAGEAGLAEDDSLEDPDDVTRTSLSARRTVGSMSAMSGANGMIYMEYSTKGQAGGAGRGAGKSAKPKDPLKRHTLFKSRFR
eukprot:SM000430S15903  [mRNA]  locus=s430:21227:22889:+ [translate_table: standard]